MDAEKCKALEAAGWKFGDAADFLEMTDEERQLLDARVSMALAIPKLRARLKLSQQDLAKRLKTSQPRVAKIERAAADVSLDQIFRAYAMLGGRIVVKDAAGPVTSLSPEGDTRRTPARRKLPTSSRNKVMP